jgi:HD-GYP domain-containing protein (c-di-GMP phosphodiesterase class II)
MPAPARPNVLKPAPRKVALWPYVRLSLAQWVLLGAAALALGLLGVLGSLMHARVTSVAEQGAASMIEQHASLAAQFADARLALLERGVSTLVQPIDLSAPIAAPELVRQLLLPVRAAPAVLGLHMHDRPHGRSLSVLRWPEAVSASLAGDADIIRRAPEGTAFVSIDTTTRMSNIAAWDVAQLRFWNARGDELSAPTLAAERTLLDALADPVAVWAKVPPPADFKGLWLPDLRLNAPASDARAALALRVGQAHVVGVDVALKTALAIEASEPASASSPVPFNVLAFEAQQQTLWWRATGTGLAEHLIADALRSVRDATGAQGPAAQLPAGLAMSGDRTGMTAAPAMQSGTVIVDGSAWAYQRRLIDRPPSRVMGLHVVALAPVQAFARPLQRFQRDVWLWTLGVTLLGLVLALWVTRGMSRSLRVLAVHSERLRQSDFADSVVPPMSGVKEIEQLAAAQVGMKSSLRERTAVLQDAQHKLARLVEAGLQLGRNHDRNALLRDILHTAREIAHCEAATLFLKTPHNTLRFAERTRDDALPTQEIALTQAGTGQPELSYVVAYAANRNERVVIDDVYAETRFDLSGTKRFSEQSGLRAVSMLALPLTAPQGEVLGVLQFVNALHPVSGEVVPFSQEVAGFLDAMAAQSAIALENLNLLAAQRELMDALIRLIAGAIDAKSPHTGGHCERVPELALMLAKAASETRQAPFDRFELRTDAQWREFRVGAWLHDCGKVTTPEYVVDKATKLETLYNRLHEIRTRFEVLWRDAEIACLQAVLNGQPEDQARAACQQRQQALQADFAFLAQCNLGAESMSADAMRRVRDIGAQTWLRHFDDRLGLSAEEHHLARHEPRAALPAHETLLADKPRHRVERASHDALHAQHGFKMQVPSLLYDRGELHNLCVSRGTLTDEERYKVNEHITQTILMLEQLPLPHDLRRVPEYAGTHHETLKGTGYPRRLGASALSMPARIMAVADIFEALTAADRPYKRANSLSEAVTLLHGFKRRGHIDPDVFDLFLTSGVYARYAERFLSPAQRDTVDISGFLGPV